MSRRIVTKSLHRTNAAETVDSYSDKLIKYIPADVVGAWIATKGIIEGAGKDFSKEITLWIAFGVGVVITCLWTYQRTKDPEKKPAITQISLSTLAFVVWTIATGAPFSWNPTIGSLLLILFTLLVPLINPPEN